MIKLLLFSNFILSFAFINLNTCKIITNNNYNNNYNNIYNNKLNFCMTLEEEFEERKKKYFNDIANEKLNNNINKNNKKNIDIDDSLEINFNLNQLVLLDNIKTIEYSKKWIRDMVINGINFPQYMYKDMYIMREYSENNKSLLDFYIGYYPFANKDINDPIYIGYFSVNPFKRLFSCKSIIQNPNYNDNVSYLINFKNNIEKVSRDAKCKLIFEDLKNLENKRYWMSWFYN